MLQIICENRRRKAGGRTNNADMKLAPQRWLRFASHKIGMGTVMIVSSRLSQTKEKAAQAWPCSTNIVCVFFSKPKLCECTGNIHLCYCSCFPLLPPHVNNIPMTLMPALVSARFSLSSSCHFANKVLPK